MLRIAFHIFYGLFLLASLPACAQDCEATKLDVVSLYTHFQSLADSGEVDKATTVCRQVEKIAARCPETCAFYLIGALRYFAETNPSLDSTEMFISRAEELVAKYAHLIHGDDYHIAVTPIHYNRCRQLSRMGLSDKAIVCFETLENIIPDHVFHPIINAQRQLVLSQLGVLHFLKGNYPESLRWNLQALDILDPTQLYYLWYKGVIHLYLAQTYAKLGEQKNARQQFSQSVQALLSLDFQKRQITDDYLLDTYLALCDFYLVENQAGAALAVVDSAFLLHLRKEWNLPLAYLKKGEILQRMNEQTKSLECLEKALQLSYTIHQQGKHVNRSLIFKALGEYYLEKNEPMNALGHLQQALAQLSNDFPTDSLDKNPDLKSSPFPLELLALLRLKGQAFAAQARLESKQQPWLKWAAATYLEAVELLQILRTEYDLDESKELLLQHSFALFEEGIEVCEALFLQNGQAVWREAALGFSEKSKGLSLLESLTGIQAFQVADIRPALLEKETELQAQMAFLDREVQQARTPEELKNARSRAFQHRRKQAEFRQFLRDSFPAYFELKYSFPTLSIAKLQTQLCDDETFVEYFWGDRKLYFFTVTKTTFGFNSLDLTAALQQQVEEFSLLSGDRKALDRSEKMALYQRMGYSLFQKLVEPLQIKTPKILLAADAWLNLLPFDALSTDSLPRQHFSDFPYLIRRLQITKVFSAAVLGQQLAERQPSPAKPGAPDSSPKLKPQKDLLVISPQVAGDKSLPGSPDLLAAKFGGDVLLGANATNEVVFKMAPKYRRLVFYAHAKADSVEPFIQLYGGRRLYLGDLYARHLPVQLVVLAACEAGTGKIKRGEGIFSLARGFAYSGVPAVSLTLWEVRSGTTLLLADYFLEWNLKKGLPPGDAMHRAKLQFLDAPVMGDASPYLWAGVVMVGK